MSGNRPEYYGNTLVSRDELYAFCIFRSTSFSSPSKSAPTQTPPHALFHVEVSQMRQPIIDRCKKLPGRVVNDIVLFRSPSVVTVLTDLIMAPSSDRLGSSRQAATSIGSPAFGEVDSSGSSSHADPNTAAYVAPGGRPLVFELIPQIMHFKCVRAVLPNDVWRLLRKMTIDHDGKRCDECGSSHQLECHEVWEYLTLPDLGSGRRHVMKLCGLRTLCHLCHLGKHIGFAQKNAQLYQMVKTHLMDLYRLPEATFTQLEQIAFEHVWELNKVGARALDLTYLNDERFIWIQHRFGRLFSDDEAASCRRLGAMADIGVQNQSPLQKS